MDEGLRGVRSTNWQSQNSQGDVKCSVENGVVKELTQMTNGLEQSARDYLPEGVEGAGWRGKGGKIGTTVTAE